MNKDCLIIKKDEYTKLLTENEELKREIKEVTTPNSIRVVVSASYGGTHFIDLYEGNIALSENIYRQVRRILDKVLEHSKKYVKESMQKSLQRTLHRQSTEHIELIEKTEMVIDMLKKKVLKEIDKVPFRKRKTKKEIDYLFDTYFTRGKINKRFINDITKVRYE